MNPDIAATTIKDGCVKRIGRFFGFFRSKFWPDNGTRSRNDEVEKSEPYIPIVTTEIHERDFTEDAGEVMEENLGSVVVNAGGMDEGNTEQATRPRRLCMHREVRGLAGLNPKGKNEQEIAGRLIKKEEVPIRRTRLSTYQEVRGLVDFRPKRKIIGGGKKDQQEMAGRRIKKEPVGVKNLVGVGSRGKNAKNEKLKAAKSKGKNALKAPNAFTCFICKKTFQKEKILYGHIVKRQCDQNYQKLWKCPKCDICCANLSCLCAHYVAKHNPNPLECQYCGKKSGSKGSMSKHQKQSGFCKRTRART